MAVILDQVEQGRQQEEQGRPQEAEDQHPGPAGGRVIAQDGPGQEKKFVDPVEQEVQRRAVFTAPAAGPGQHPVGAVDDRGELGQGPAQGGRPGAPPVEEKGPGHAQGERGQGDLIGRNPRSKKGPDDQTGEGPVDPAVEGQAFEGVAIVRLPADGF